MEGDIQQGKSNNGSETISDEVKCGLRLTIVNLMNLYFDIRASKHARYLHDNGVHTITAPSLELMDFLKEEQWSK